MEYTGYRIQRSYEIEVAGSRGVGAGDWANAHAERNTQTDGDESHWRGGRVLLLNIKEGTEGWHRA